MATNPLNQQEQAPKPNSLVIQWLLDSGSDPSIRWQVMRDLTSVPQEEVAAERARVATEGWGARLLSMQGADGSWGGTTWNHGWDSTMHVLYLVGCEFAAPVGLYTLDREGHLFSHALQE